MSLIELGLATDFYVTGGTLRSDAPCYVQRQADTDLLQALQQGKFCYVLTARQSGKSSLMVQTAVRLRAAGIGVAILDLTAIGSNLTIEQWYGGLLSLIGQQLDLEDELLDFYAHRALLSPLQSWMRALREIVLPRYMERVVIFVDEIDAVHNLPFSTDEFFAGIRNFYNERTTNPALEKLTFCLLGVATAADLISDARTTPFNVGLRIELNDFQAHEAAVLARGLAREKNTGYALMQRVLFWTNGHPYLTQRLCQQLAQDPTATLTADVDRHCQALFLAPRALERDDNLLFVRERLLRTETDLSQLFEVYGQVLQNKRVPDEENNLLVNELRLAGLVKVQDGYLQIRNRIYERIFTRAWLKQHLPDAALQRQRRAFWRGVIRATAIATFILLLISALALLALRQRDEAQAQRQANRHLLYASEMSVVAQAWESANVARVQELLAKQLPASGQEDWRGFEWGYYQRLTQQLQQRTFKFSSLVQGVAYAPTGQWFAVALDDGSVKLLEVTTGQEICTLYGHADRAYWVAFSPDSKFLASASFDKTVRIWEVASGKTIYTLRDFKEKVVSVAFAPNGKWLAASDASGTAQLWDIAAEKLLHSFVANGGWANAVAFSADSQKLAIAQPERVVNIFSTQNFRLLQKLSHEAEVTSVAFAPDGQTLATGCYHTALASLWDLRTGKIQQTFRGHTGVVWHVAFSPDGKILATSGDDSLTRLWDVQSGALLTRLVGHSSYIFSAAFSPDGKALVTGGWDKSVKLWPVLPTATNEMRMHHQDWIKAVQYTPDNRLLLSASEDGVVNFWDTHTHQAVQTWENSSHKLKAVAFDPSGNYVATANDKKEISIWHRPTASLIRLPSLHESELRTLAFSSDAKWLASGDMDGWVKIWDVQAGKLLYEEHSFKYLVFALAFTPDNSQLVMTGGYEKMRAIDVRSHQEVFALSAVAQGGRQLVFSPNGKLLAAEIDDTTVAIIDMQSHTIIRQLRGHTARLTSFSFTPDGKRLATSSVDGAVKIWELNAGLELSTIYSHAGKIFAISFAPDGKTLAAACADKAIHLWQSDK